MIIGTKTEFENLADYILRDYLGSEYDSYSPLNVDAFAKDYLKLDISYCQFDPNEHTLTLMHRAREEVQPSSKTHLQSPPNESKNDTQ